MTDREPGTGFEPLRYHRATKHTPASVRSGTHRIDWMDQPEQFKSYPNLEPIPLPDPAPDTGFPAMKAVVGAKGGARHLDLPELTRLVTLAAGVNRVVQQAGGKPAYLRTYACAGALYPIEVYLACSDVDGVDPGVYHYGPLDNTLRQVRTGDPRPYLVRASGFRPSLAAAPVTVLLTGIPWRTNWKYRARGYRHLFWDSGMILANLLALCASGGHSSEVVLGFVDEETDRLLGIDGRGELSLCLVPVGFAERSRPPAEPAEEPAPPVSHEVGRLSFRQRNYDEVVEAQAQTALSSPAEAQLWHQDPFPNRQPPPPDVSFTGIEQVIRRRGSKRRFLPGPIPKDELEAIIACSTYDLDCDWGLGLTQVAVIVNDVEGLEPGAYSAVWNLEPIALGNLRDKARFLCLEQDLGGDAAATLFLLTDLEDATRALGARGYRAAQLNAGIVAGWMYLGAYACGFGATGLTFYDDEVREFFRTEAEPMLVVALGR
ncbi:MAG TPA: SagB/ThcOx family dehydrogenase [Actinomycetota bacterium]|nr:SagB/ThcOx family dehydrogenase [Actinomycetota bacterium]